MSPVISIKHGDAVVLMPEDVAPSSVDLVVADPPYFKVASEKWDYQWRTEMDYVKWSEGWIKEAAKSLRLGGSFYLFGYFRTLALLIPTLDHLGLKLRQQIIIDKGIQAVSGRATKNYKMFPNVTESVIFLVKDPIPFTRNFLKERQRETGLTAKAINEALGVKSNGGGMWSIYTGKNVCEQMPTKEQWEKLQQILEFDLPYTELSITFNAQLGLTDVWNDIDFYAERKTRVHPTQKPLQLIERIIQASSNQGDLVLDPFLGSGTTAVASKKLKRDCIGYELDSDYIAATKERLSKAQF